MSTLTARERHAEANGAVAQYVRDLNAQLRGPAGMRRSMVAEARDGLEDTTDCLTANGTTRAEAERLAVAEFGPVCQVAPAFQHELAVVQARRTGLFVLAAFPALLVAWDVLWQGMNPGVTTPGVVVLLAGMTDWVSYAMAVAGALTVLALTRWGRRVVSPRRVMAPFGVLVLAGLGCLAGFSWAMMAYNVDDTQQAVTTWLGIAVNTASCAGVVWACCEAVRSVRLAGRIAVIRHG